ncbi:MAG: HAD-IIIA family hydrolase [Tepidisphaeraceae bacterium]|jgi:histidinol-phosphate phosphatase family protein
MKPAAVFFDRDNTLIVNDGYLGDPNGVILVAGAAAAIARAHERGFLVVTVSNQSGVAKGLFTEEAVSAVNGRMEQLLLRENPRATIDRNEFCPFHPQAIIDRYRMDSDLRKPKPGMILRAARALDIDLSRSWLIGDAPRDIAAGKAAGCRTILLRLPGIPTSGAVNEDMVAPDFNATSLAEAMEFVSRDAAN